MTMRRAAALLVTAVMLVACNPVRVEVTEVEEAGPILVFDVTNQSSRLRDLRYEIAEPGGASAGSTSAIPCARTVIDLGRASRTIEVTVDGGGRIGSYTVTPADARAAWLVMQVTIDPTGAAVLVGVEAADEDPMASVEAIPGCED